MKLKIAKRDNMRMSLDDLDAMHLDHIFPAYWLEKNGCPKWIRDFEDNRQLLTEDENIRLKSTRRWSPILKSIAADRSRIVLAIRNERRALGWLRRVWRPSLTWSDILKK